ncbi:hypothetical protein [Actinophytocola sp.]|uniref:hypothetical protein n=1 Tax=Actinophytocola sp. TaxID=1872138 RepID=UPI002D7E6A0F|nr:hypothetical protein [Actinophytocola sp.]HET9144069.1 hypothetical protein [Actinophytocola sp.]
MADLEPIERPDGRTYRPRKIVAWSWEDDTVHGWSAGAVVLGTHDVDRARVLADSSIKAWFGSELSAVEPEVGWYRLGYEYGEQIWAVDERRGRAGVWFTAKEVVEPG